MGFHQLQASHAESLEAQVFFEPCCQIHMCFSGVNVVQFTFIGAVSLVGLTEINQTVVTLIKSNQTKRGLKCYHRFSVTFV